MSNVAISALPNAASLTGTESVPIVQSAATVKATAQAIANLAPVTSVNGQTGSVALDGDDVLPSQGGHSGEFLTTNGTTVSWGAASGGGKSAFARINSSGTILTGSHNVDSVTHPSTGSYVVTVTSAGFSSQPAAVATGFDVFWIGVVVSSATTINVTIVDHAENPLDLDFNLIALGL